MPTPQTLSRARARAEINVQLFLQSLIFVLTLCVQKCIIYVETPKTERRFDMAKSANLNARIEPELKEQAEEILAALGIPASNAINVLPPDYPQQRTSV